MTIQTVIDYLNLKIPPYYQEDYDNSGIQVGDPTIAVTGVLVALDLTPDVIDEAIDKGFNLICTHHPLLFGKGLRRVTPSTEVGRMVIRLLQHNITVYAAHTSLDNLRQGVSGALADQLGLTDCQVLQPKVGLLCKLVTYCPVSAAAQVRQALFDAGAGTCGNYDRCSFNNDGVGTFRAHEGCHPYCGALGEEHHEPEVRIEVVYEQHLEQQLIARLRAVHPYEEPAFDCLPLRNAYSEVGGGIVGRLAVPMAMTDFLHQVKTQVNIPCLRVSDLVFDRVERVAVCGGSGSFLIDQAKAVGAQLYLTGDLKYHDFQQAEGRIVLGDIGHYESEQFARQVIFNTIREKFSNFAVQLSARRRGYVNYI